MRRVVLEAEFRVISKLGYKTGIEGSTIAKVMGWHAKQMKIGIHPIFHESRNVARAERVRGGRVLISCFLQSFGHRPRISCESEHRSYF